MVVQRAITVGVLLIARRAMAERIWRVLGMRWGRAVGDCRVQRREFETSDARRNWLFEEIRESLVFKPAST